MKVAMVTPMSPESAIADVMMQALPHLNDTWDIDVWCPWEPRLRPCSVELYPYSDADDETLRRLSQYDLVIYVLGNSPWHSRILPLARALPGLVVLHDVAMTDLVRHMAVERDLLNVLAARIASETSPTDAEAFRQGRHADGSDGWLRLSARNPMIDYATEGSLGALVHSNWHAGLVEGRTLGDVTVAPLPVPSTRLGFETAQRVQAEAHLDGLPDSAVLVVTVGAANANRRIDALIDAVATDDPLLERIHLWAVGPGEPVAMRDLYERAERAGITDRFQITGAVSDVLLQDILDRADVAAALREPVLEGQSASVLTQMLAGLPTLVLDHAHYSELPDDIALKIDPAEPVSGLVSALRGLVADPAERAARGSRGRDYVLATRNGEAYADAIATAGDRALAARPVVLLSADLARSARRLGLHAVPRATAAMTDLAFELFDLA